MDIKSFINPPDKEIVNNAGNLLDYIAATFSEV